MTGLPAERPASLRIQALEFGFTTAGTERMVVDSSGNVGIGRATPNATLDVSGTIKVAGTGSESCDANKYGVIRYNPVNQRMERCKP